MLPQVLINGLSLSSFYAAIAVGFTLIFGVMKVVNFAHGELFMLGAFTFGLLTFAGVPFIVSLIVVVVVIGLLGIVLDQLFLKRIRGDLMAGVMVTVGISLILQVAALKAFGTQEKVIPSAFPGIIQILGAHIPVDRLVVIGITVAMMVALWFFLERSRQGRAVRACMQDSEAAALQGVNLNMSCMISMGIGASLAGMAGLLMSPTVIIDPWVGIRPLWIAFIVVIVGGLGSVGGTVAAALLFGFLDSIITTLVDPKIVILIDVIVALIVLVTRPRGIFSRATI